MRSYSLLNLNEASLILGIKVKTVYQWKRLRKYLQLVRVGKYLMINERALKAFIEERKKYPKACANNNVATHEQVRN
jgi:predicted site-specific integrase-resolvase